MPLIRTKKPLPLGKGSSPIQDFINQNDIKYIYHPTSKSLRSLPVNKEISFQMEFALAQMDKDVILISEEMLNETEFMKKYISKYGKENLPYISLMGKWGAIYTQKYKSTGFYKIALKDKSYFINENSVYDGKIVKKNQGDTFFVHNNEEYSIIS